MTDSVLLSPKSIAIIGASDKTGSIGRAVTNNIINDYKGKLFLINPKRKNRRTITNTTNIILQTLLRILFFIILNNNIIKNF